MRGIGRLATPGPTAAATRTLGPSYFSTFSGGGGRGRGRGSGTTNPSPPSDSTSPNRDASDDALSGLGHGRGKPLPSNPVLPTFSSWMSASNPSAGRGRVSHSDFDPDPAGSLSKKPIFFRRDEDQSQFSDPPKDPNNANLPASVTGGLPGMGRGKATKSPITEPRAPDQNRHIRPRSTPAVSRRTDTGEQGSGPRMSRADAVKKAVEILGRGGDGGRGARGRGRGRGFRGRGRGGAGRGRDDDGDFATGLYLGDNADGERLAKRLGEEKMNKLVEAFEEMSWRVLPSPMDDAYLDAEHTNNMIEYEPEYLMGEFTTNPDIDEKPPIPLRDALEKMKPFLMTYEGIQSQEEWEQIIEELMERLPIFKEIIDYYSGPNRVTAKQQQEELERVAKTIPENVPASVKRFTDRAVLSLQSNPGWGWDKKCQFMDKLAWEVTQQYK